MQQTMGIVMGLDDWKPWGQEDQVKVGCHLMQLLIGTAYIQPPVNQLGDGPPDICPAFKHNLKTVTTDSQKDVKRYGVIEGLEKAARHMVIPYMPMLVPPTAYTCINIYLQFVWKQVVQLLSSDLSVHKEESSSARQRVLQIMHTPRPPTN